MGLCRQFTVVHCSVDNFDACFKLKAIIVAGRIGKYLVLLSTTDIGILPRVDISIADGYLKVIRSRRSFIIAHVVGINHAIGGIVIFRHHLIPIVRVEVLKILILIKVAELEILVWLCGKLKINVNVFSKAMEA